MEPVVLAGDITNWVDNTTNWLSTTIPVVFLTLVFGFGVWMLIMTRGAIRKLIVFAIGAAVVYMLLTNVDALARMFGTEVVGAPAPAPIVAAVDAGREI
ncbi:hypothetical protein [Krasilnikovia sp. MM14-A1259]|uniref:hypothetical protein n=1 Tax=Krasilnikovia sp. MM14-A1259 TaxID=3373539 RepID=UPI0037FE635E